MSGPDPMRTDPGYPESPYWKGAATGDADLPQAASQHLRAAYVAQSTKQKDHVAAGLLAIFLGVFGIHKFYLGYNQAAFIMLAVSIIGGIVTFGLAPAVIEVISIIEGVIYLTKSQTDFERIYVLGQRDWF